jgi:hypothetical protein
MIVKRLTGLALAILASFALAVNPASAQTAEQLFTEGKLVEALALFQSQIANRPGNVRARYYVALISVRQSKMDLAREQIQKILELAPQSQEADYARKIAASYHLDSSIGPTSVGNSNKTDNDEDLRYAEKQAAELTAQAEREAQALDRKADQLARDMQATPAVGRRSSGSAYSQTAIEDATTPLRSQATEVRQRGKREAADLLMRAQLRASAPASRQLQISRRGTEAADSNQSNDDRQHVVPYVDEISYWRDLRKMRLGQALAATLLLKPKYRGQILSGKATVDEVKNSYSASEKAIDEAWIQAHQSAQRQFIASRELPVDLAGYDINQFVGLRCGQYSTLFDDDGMCYKIFFDFKDPSTALTPELYLQFVKRLAQSAFTGDSKICMQPGYVRFNYNDIIVHTGSPKLAQLAEAVGVDVFNSRLEYVGRGVDVRGSTGSTGRGETLDWHHYLAAYSDLSRLSTKALNFIGVAAP